MKYIPAQPPSDPTLLSEFLRRELQRIATALNSNSHLELLDGVAAPAQVGGLARIYVDQSDGDLKIVFGDGTSKTIVVDT